MPNPGEPYCSNCGYKLKGLTHSSKCPECGQPLVDVLTRDSLYRKRSRRYKSDITIFGQPLLHIATGPTETERIGIARGIIAIGDIAIGWFALGGFACGLVALGGMSVGLVALGGGALALLVGMGGFSTGALAIGGLAIGGAALGGGAIAYIAQGGGAVGVYARGGGAFGQHTISVQAQDPVALQFFEHFQWLFGPAGPAPSPVFALWVVVAAVIIAALIALPVFIKYFQHAGSSAENLR